MLINHENSHTGESRALKAKLKLIDQVREIIRYKHYSIRTEQAYVDWIRRFILFHAKQHPKDLREPQIVAFLSDLAVRRKVASSTQNQALCAIVFLYREVLKIELGDLSDIRWAKKPRKLPVVFTREEVKRILLQLEGMNWLMGQVMYGAGLRVMECIRLRVKDIDFGYRQIVVRDGKGSKDRVTMLPQIIVDELQRHLLKVKAIHNADLKAGFGAVY
jgi:integrase